MNVNTDQVNELYFGRFKEILDDIKLKTRNIKE